MIRLRQICLVAHDRDTVVADLCAVFGIEVAWEDPAVAGFGLHNAVLPVGDQFLEVVSPVRDGTAAGRYLARRGGDGGYMLIFQAVDHAPVRTRVEASRTRVVTDVTTHGYTCFQLHPADTGGTFLEIDHMEPPDDWHPAGPTWRDHVDTSVVTGFAQADVGCSDPARVAGLWSTLLAVPVTIGSNCGMHKVRPTDFCVRFPPAGTRGEGLDTVEMTSVDTQLVLDRARSRGLDVTDGAVTIGGVAFVPR